MNIIPADIKRKLNFWRTLKQKQTSNVYGQAHKTQEHELDWLAGCRVVQRQSQDMQSGLGRNIF